MLGLKLIQLIKRGAQNNMDALKSSLFGVIVVSGGTTILV